MALVYRLGEDVCISLKSLEDGDFNVAEEKGKLTLRLINFTGELEVQVQSLTPHPLEQPLQTVPELLRESSTGTHDPVSPVASPVDEKKSTDTPGEVMQDDPPPLPTSPSRDEPSGLLDEDPDPLQARALDFEADTSNDIPSSAVSSLSVIDSAPPSTTNSISDDLAALATPPPPPNLKKRGKAAFKDLAKKIISKNHKGSEDNQHPDMNKLSDNWATALMVASGRKRMPDSARERRSFGSQSSIRQDSSQLPPPTRLHAVCADPNVQLEDVQTCLAEIPGSVRIRDSQGNLPIHVLGNNDRLVASAPGRVTGTSIALALMQAYPEGLTEENNDGHFPFVSLIVDWILWTYKPKDKPKQADSDTNKVINLITKDSRNEVRVSIDTVEIIDEQPVVFTEMVDEKSTSTFHSQQQRAKGVMVRSERTYPNVELWEEVEWSFNMLSMAVDELGGKSGGLHKVRLRSLIHHTVKDRTAREAIIKHLCEQVPTLLKTLLLLDDDGGSARTRLFRLSLVRRVLLCPDSVGPWLTNMLQRHGLPSKRAVDYMVMVSEATAEDYIGGYRSILPGDFEAFYNERNQVFEMAGKLKGTIASFVTLDTWETERAASTAMAWHIMDKNLERPFVVGLVLIDLVLHITLMLAFRNDVQFVDPSSGNPIGNVPTQVVIFICSHYFLRKVCEANSMWSLSPKVFRNYFANVWTFFDLVAIILTLTATVWNDNHPFEYRQGFNAFVLGLLWIKVLGFLKVINRDMSTFILALIQILSDLKNFGVVLLVIIFMFGDMMNIALRTKDNGLYCLANTEDLSGVAEDFCTEELYRSYLRVYALLLGDFELDDYKESTGITILFVLFTLLGVVILLNVLIAIISDSYEKAKIKSLLLFGRARVTFVAQNDALERFLRPTSKKSAKKGAPSPRRLVFTNNPIYYAIRASFRWVVMLAIIGTAMDAEVFLVARAISAVRAKETKLVILVFCTYHISLWPFRSRCSSIQSFSPIHTVFLLAALLTCALWVVMFFAVAPFVRKHFPQFVVKAFDCIDRYTAMGTQRIASRLFGLRDVRILAPGEDGEVEEEWLGRMMHLERKIDRVIDNTKEELVDELKDLEKRLCLHQDQVWRTASGNPSTPTRGATSPPR